MRYTLRSRESVLLGIYRSLAFLADGVLLLCYDHRQELPYLMENLFQAEHLNQMERVLDISTKRQNSNGGDSEYKFGQFHQVENSLSCERCALVIPSKETGRFVCSRTWWCQTCTGVTLIRSGDLLRVPHLLKC